MKNIGAAGLQGEGPQGRPPQAAVAGRPQAAPQPRRSRGALRALCRGLQGGCGEAESGPSLVRRGRREMKGSAFKPLRSGGW